MQSQKNNNKIQILTIGSVVASVQEWEFWCVQCTYLFHTCVHHQYFVVIFPEKLVHGAELHFRVLSYQQQCNLATSLFYERILDGSFFHLTWIWVPKSFRAWIQAATAIQASLFFSLKRAENIANLALWPGSNLTWVHPLDSMGPEDLFPEMCPEYLGSVLHL